MWLETVATETAGDTPRKINSGVIRKPPPMPNMPEITPTAKPDRQDDEDIDRQVGDRKVDLHGRCSVGSKGNGSRAAEFSAMREW